jgi:hypothetical protein
MQNLKKARTERKVVSQLSPMSQDNPTYPKDNRLTRKSASLTRKSISLSRKSIGLSPNPACGILCALAHGKLYFEFPETFPGTQNHLPHTCGGTRSEVVRPLRKFSISEMLCMSHQV